jgi:hypothetical protein
MLVTGPPIYEAPHTGQIRKADAVGQRSSLEIHDLGTDGRRTLCGNMPVPGKVLQPLGRGPVTCGACAGHTGHR